LATSCFALDLDDLGDLLLLVLDLDRCLPGDLDRLDLDLDLDLDLESDLESSLDSDDLGDLELVPDFDLDRDLDFDLSLDFDLDLDRSRGRSRSGSHSGSFVLLERTGVVSDRGFWLSSLSMIVMFVLLLDLVCFYSSSSLLSE